MRRRTRAAMRSIGIRREDRPGERRVPLVPADAAGLVAGGTAVRVQPSSARVFGDAEYAAAGVPVDEELAGCDAVLGVKEMAVAALRPGCTYLCFSHTTKGQPHGMPLVRQLLALGCSLIDYELVTDAEGRRLLTFGRHAGRAGLVDALGALGRRLAVEGVDSPFAALAPCHRYADWTTAAAALRTLGRRIARDGLPAAVVPLCVGVAGYGNVARGFQEALDLLPVRDVAPADLLRARLPGDPHRIFRVTFREEHTLARVGGGGLDAAELAAHPERYASRFDAYLPRLALLANCIAWEPGRPRLVTCDALAEAARAGRSTPRVIADLACDIRGAIECTVRATSQDEPTFCWDPLERRARPGVAGPGPVVLAVDNLPSELPRDAATEFSASLVGFVPGLGRVDPRAASAEASGLSRELARAAVVWRGALTPRFRYLEPHLAGEA